MKLSTTKLVIESAEYMIKNYKSMSVFCLICYVFMCSSKLFGGWQRPEFLIILAIAYIALVYFFRFYFNKKPFFQLKSVGKSLIPSTKIFMIMLLFTSLLIFLPFLGLFIDAGTNYWDKYMQYLQAFQQESQVVDLVLNMLFIFTSPIFLYRPSLAFISSLLGRSPSLRTAWKKSTDNYWVFFSIVFGINIALLLLRTVFTNDYIFFIFASGLTMYFNIILAKTYEILFNLEQ